MASSVCCSWEHKLFSLKAEEGCISECPLIRLKQNEVEEGKTNYLYVMVLDTPLHTAVVFLVDLFSCLNKGKCLYYCTVNKTMNSVPEESQVTSNSFDCFPVFAIMRKNCFSLGCWGVTVATSVLCCACYSLILGLGLVGLSRASVAGNYAQHGCYPYRLLLVCIPGFPNGLEGQAMFY